MNSNFRKFGIFLVIVLILAFSFLGTLIVMATEWFWFKEVGYANVFTTTLKSKALMGSGSALVLAVILSLNVLIAKRVRIRGGPILYHDAIEIPELRFVRRITNRILWIMVLVFAYVFGQWGASQWETWLKYQYPAPFGVVDPLYSRDIGFYVFTLPFYQFLYSFFIATTILSIIVAALLYFAYGEIRLTLRGLRFSKGARIHLFMMAALLLLLTGIHFYLSTYDLLYSERGLVYGAGYTDVNAELPALKFLVVASVFVALLAVINAFRSGIRFISVGIVIVLAGALIGTKLYPEMVQKYDVAPNERRKEEPYIANAIKYTRLAYGIDNVVEKEFPAHETLTEEELRKNDVTIKNIRLWDRRPLLITYGQLQEIRTYYNFVDADNDRYYIDGDYRQVMFSPRELLHDKLQDRRWINEHLTYTHGYGLCLGPVNRVTKEGMPEFFIKDIPPTSSIAGLKVTRPEIYYGEITRSYCFVKTGSKEFDYPSGNENVYATYQGTGGVPADHLLKKFIFALRFGDINILLSSDITQQSRIMYYRRILDRVSKATPFLIYDPDPYMVISKDGRLYWICDGYTTTDKYPYSEPTPEMGNYIRNSVKAIVDAYNGTIDFFISDETDPLIQAYKKMFPGLLKPLALMREDLKSHIRYPERLFATQARMYATYHMKDPQVFYNKEDQWKIPQRVKGDGQAVPMEPYYTVMRLASEGTSEEFILMVPFTPAKKDNMIAWMAARCDVPNYGKIIVYGFPKQRLIYGPQQIESRIDQDPEISKELTLWNQRGSAVIRGSLLVIPIETSIIYVQPLYLSATETGSLPELKRVILAFGNTIAMEENLERALARIFGGLRLDERPKPPETVSDAARTEPSTPLTSLIEQANEHFSRAMTFQREGNWAGYGEEMRKVEELLRAMRRQKK